MLMVKQHHWQKLFTKYRSLYLIFNPWLLLTILSDYCCRCSYPTLLNTQFISSLDFVVVVIPSTTKRRMISWSFIATRLKGSVTDDQKTWNLPYDNGGINEVSRSYSVNTIIPLFFAFSFLNLVDLWKASA